MQEEPFGKTSLWECLLCLFIVAMIGIKLTWNNAVKLLHACGASDYCNSLLTRCLKMLNSLRSC